MKPVNNNIGHPWKGVNCPPSKDNPDVRLLNLHTCIHHNRFPTCYLCGEEPRNTSSLARPPSSRGIDRSIVQTSSRPMASPYPSAPYQVTNYTGLNHATANMTQLQAEQARNAALGRAVGIDIVESQKIPRAVPYHDLHDPQARARRERLFEAIMDLTLTPLSRFVPIENWPKGNPFIGNWLDVHHLLLYGIYQCIRRIGDDVCKIRRYLQQAIDERSPRPNVPVTVIDFHVACCKAEFQRGCESGDVLRDDVRREAWEEGYEACMDAIDRGDTPRRRR